MKILVTGATGKVGQEFIRSTLTDPRFEQTSIRAFCHNREVAAHERIEIVKGSIESREDVTRAVSGVTHVLHLATTKETPETIMDVAVKGLFWLLEACRESDSFQQFIMVGGDAGMGHFFYPHPLPVTEQQKHSPYPGCYALSKVLEETMLEQYYIQYDLNGCCLRAPWIMEKDDFRYSLSFGKDVFGGPVWRQYVTPELADQYKKTQTVPILCDSEGKAIDRNMIQLEDLVKAIKMAIDHPKAKQQLFNISMDEPVNYGKAAEYISQTRGFSSVKIKTEYQSTWLDNSKAKFLLRWRPDYDYKKMIDQAFDFQRAEDNPRVVWYPG